MDDNVDVIIERPLSKKVEKEMERKMNDRETLETEFNDALTGMTDDRTMYMMERRQADSKTENDRSELLALKKNKIDMEIMKLDFVGMNAIQEYFQNL